MATCRKCYAPIRFATTRKNGVPIPLDPHPDSTGTIAAFLVGDRYVDAYPVTPKSPARKGYTLFVPHVATCGQPMEARLSARGN